MRRWSSAGFSLIDTDNYEDLRDALDRLALNDAALSYEPETSDALGFGFRCGFLGLLHMDIVRERLEREYDLELLATTPNVRYEVTLIGGEVVEVRSPTEMPDPAQIAEIAEPFIRATIIAPSDYVGAVMELCQKRRGEHVGMHYLSPTRVQIQYDLPLAEIVLTSSTSSSPAEPRLRLARLRADREPPLEPGQAGRAARRRQGRRAVADRPQGCGLRSGPGPGRAPPEDDPATAVRRPGPGRDWVERSPETVKALRKDVTAKLYGGDVTRKRKLLEKQKKGKKRMKQVGASRCRRRHPRGASG